MALQTLHTITVDDLALTNPALHAEYVILVTKLIDKLRELSKQNSSILTSSGLTEKYDTNSNEAYLDLILSNERDSFSARIYIHQLKYFLIEVNGIGKLANTAEDVLNIADEGLSKIF